MAEADEMYVEVRRKSLHKLLTQHNSCAKPRECAHKTAPMPFPGCFLVYLKTG